MLQPLTEPAISTGFVTKRRREPKQLRPVTLHKKMINRFIMLIVETTQLDTTNPSIKQIKLNQKPIMKNAPYERAQMQVDLFGVS